jgi:hypothetical protein
MPSITLIELKVFLFTPKGKSGLKTHRHTAKISEDDAEKVVRAFYGGQIHKVWKALDPATKARITTLGIDPKDAVNGEVGVDGEHIATYAPDLLH